MKPTILALDLEGTLISNAVSQIPRPDLFGFLEQVGAGFERVVAFTTVKEPLFRQIAQRLVDEGVVPHWFAGIDYVRWSGPYKDLAFVSSTPGQVLIVDDHVDYIVPDQQQWWIAIPQFEYPYVSSDDGLSFALQKIRSCLDSYSIADDQ